MIIFVFFHLTGENFKIFVSLNRPFFSLGSAQLGSQSNPYNSYHFEWVRLVHFISQLHMLIHRTDHSYDNTTTIRKKEGKRRICVEVWVWNRKRWGIRTLLRVDEGIGRNNRRQAGRQGREQCTRGLDDSGSKNSEFTLDLRRHWLQLLLGRRP